MTDDSKFDEERVAALERSIDKISRRLATTTDRDIPLLKGTLRALVGNEVDTVDDLPDAGRAHRRRLEAIEARLESIEQRLETLGDIGTEKTTKEQKIVAICTFAQNKRGGQSSTVAVTADEIRGCVGVSRRYAYDLIDEAGTMDGLRVRESTDVQTSTGVEHKKKALLVDCEQVHTVEDGVNRFTTVGSDENGHDSVTERPEEKT